VDPGSDGLVAYYALDNDANDASGNSNHGTLSGDPLWVEGFLGSALEFDGVDDHVDCGNDPSLDITGPITIGAWVYPTGGGSSNYPRIVDKSDGTGGADPGYKMYLRVADNYVVTLSAGGAYLNSSTPATLDAWNYIVFVTDGMQRKLYLNGAWQLWDESAVPVSSVNPLYLGNSPAGARHFQGMIDEVTIYNRDLSVGEVLYLAGERVEEADPTLSIYYTFDEVSDVVADQSGKGHDGVVVGDVTAVAEGILAGAAQLANTGYLDLDGANFPIEDIPTSDLTLAAWANIDGTSNQNAIFNARASDSTWLIHPEIRPGNGDYRFTIRGAGGVKIGDIDGGKTGYKKPEGTPVPNEWVHVAMTYSKADATMTLYVDGQIVLRRGGDGAGDPIENAIDIAGDWGLGARVGYNIDDARHYTGLMDEFRMYTRALSQEEIAGL
jgi:hypothetical protein